ncbi:hypothetical protein ACQKOE_15635 [Novosphingobium sp. NPDC080210]|uniref:hypothetical protein n=1 Tax=Novosphingobium sp. NPDC080210 TaxID=3390596 RepID=UPI003D08E413
MTSINSKNDAHLYGGDLAPDRFDGLHFVSIHKKYMSSLYLALKVMDAVRERQPNTGFWSVLSVNVSVVRTSAIAAIEQARDQARSAKTVMQA